MEDQKMEEKKKTAGKSTAFSITGKSRANPVSFSHQRVAESALLSAVRPPFWVAATLPRGGPRPARSSDVSLQDSG
jgi:hypothetical protein